ncbi:MAG: MFS transporter [Ruminiclostridium sp.]|nr:MFS transporter [Ruminiclostridium sp.]
MKLLSDLPHNARNVFIIEPMWAVFAGMIFFYAPLYMKEIGLNEVQMGVVNTFSLFVAFLCHLLAAPITNRLGRKKTTLIFDIISWTIPLLLWAVARNFWYFFIGYAVNSFSRIVFVSWTCLVMEDSEVSKRVKIFGVTYLFSYAPGLFTPITGLLIPRFGVIPTMRVLYFFGMISITIMFFIRNKLVLETQAGMELMEKHSGLSVLQSLKSYMKTVAGVRRNKNIILISLIYIFTSFIYSMNFFQVLFINEYLGFSADKVSLVPGLVAVINIFMYVFILPKLNRYRDEKTLAGFLTVCAVGSLMLLFTPKGNLPALLVTTSIIAIGNFITQIYRDTIFMNNLGKHDKADVYSALQTLTTLICIPSGFIAGFFYDISPLLPFLTIFLLFVATILVSFLLLHSAKKDYMTSSI